QIVRKNGRRGVLTGVELLDLSHGQNISCRGRSWGCSLKEAVGDAVWEIRGDELSELGSLYRSQLGGRVGRAQEKNAAERKQLVLDNGSAERAAKLVPTEHGYGVTARIIRRACLEDRPASQVIIGMELRKRAVNVIGAGPGIDFHKGP